MRRRDGISKGVYKQMANNRKTPECPENEVKKWYQEGRGDPLGQIY